MTDIWEILLIIAHAAANSHRYLCHPYIWNEHCVFSIDNGLSKLLTFDIPAMRERDWNYTWRPQSHGFLQVELCCWDNRIGTTQRCFTRQYNHFHTKIHVLSFFCTIGLLSCRTVIARTRSVFASVNTFLVQGPQKWNLAILVKLALILRCFSEYGSQDIWKLNDGLSKPHCTD